jgi:hypothetical protein
MRRTILLALFAALALVLPTAAHAQGNEAILRDCADDGMLQGEYSASAMRNARENMPAELDEYSDCRDVLSREISAKTAASNNNNNNGGSGGSTDGGSGGASGNSGGSTAGDPTASATTAPNPTSTPSGRDPGIRIGPSTDQDWEAIGNAAKGNAEPVEINGRPVKPAASVGRNGLPGTVVAVLALLAATAVAVTVPFVRRRVVSRSSPA